MLHPQATLVEVISHDKLKGVPLLCLANKQDKPEALSIQDWLGLPCGAFSGLGLGFPLHHVGLENECYVSLVAAVLFVVFHVLDT